MKIIYLLIIETIVLSLRFYISSGEIILAINLPIISISNSVPEKVYFFSTVGYIISLYINLFFHKYTPNNIIRISQATAIIALTCIILEFFRKLTSLHFQVLILSGLFQAVIDWLIWSKRQKAAKL